MAPVRPIVALCIGTTLLSLSQGLRRGDTAKGTPEPTQFEIAMRETQRLKEAGWLKDHTHRLEASSPENLPEDLTEEAKEHYRRKLQAANSWRFFGASIPFANGPTLAALNASFYRHASVVPPVSVDWRTTMGGMYMTPVQAQYNCASCWAMAASDTVAMAYAIAQNATAIAPGVQQMCDCGNTTCCQGGWPEDAFSWMVYNGNITSNSNYNYWAMDGRTCTLQSNYPVAGKITGWERVPPYSTDDLKKAVAQQPVLVYISAGSKDFMQYISGGPNDTNFNVYNGNCSGEVNHAMVVIGYNKVANGSYYWILKNTWIKEGWGHKGFMYIWMQDGMGKCGMLSVSPLYPTYFPSSPVQATVQKGKSFPVLAGGSYWWNNWKGSTVDACKGIINPCGAGKCYSANGIARCNCTNTNGYVEVVGIPTSKCVNPSPCTAGLFNPCGSGSCTDVGDGSYFCSCSSGYVLGTLVNGAPTCVPYVASNSKGVTYVTQYGDSCSSIQASFSVSADTFNNFNPYVVCDQGNLLPGIAIVLPQSSSLLCSQQYALQPSDNCNEVSYYMSTKSTSTLLTSYSTSSSTSLSTSSTADASTTYSTMDATLSSSSLYTDPYTYPDTSAVLSANPTLNCNNLFTSQLVCVNRTVDTSVTPPVCGLTYTTTKFDNCSTIASQFHISLSTLLSLNPGLNCASLDFLRPVGVFICVSTTPSVQVNCSQWYTVQQGDSCARIWNSAGLSQFQLQYLNPGLQCQNPFLYVGRQLCINSNNTIPDPSSIPYTVASGDTWASIQAQFTSKCKASSITLDKIASASSISNWVTYTLKAGVQLTIPCVPKVGASCGCAPSLTVCGADLVNYQSYCDARCNFASPVTSGPCTSCQNACSGRYGKYPNPNDGTVCPLNFVCYWPQWPPSTTDALAVYSNSNPLCSYRQQTCQQSCAMYNSLMNLGTDSTCYNQCFACHKVPCVGPSSTVPPGPVDGNPGPCNSGCSASPGCSASRSTVCNIDCSYFNSLYNPLNP